MIGRKRIRHACRIDSVGLSLVRAPPPAPKSIIMIAFFFDDADQQDDADHAHDRQVCPNSIKASNRAETGDGSVEMIVSDGSHFIEHAEHDIDRDHRRRIKKVGLARQGILEGLSRALKGAGDSDRMPLSTSAPWIAVTASLSATRRQGDDSVMAEASPGD